MPTPFLTSAPAKVILFGEHSAVYGKHAIASSLQSLRTYLYVTSVPNDNTITLDFPDIKLHQVWHHHILSTIDTPPSYASSIDPHISKQIHTLIAQNHITDQLHINATFCFLYLYKCLIPTISNLKFQLISTSPIGAGLGSSAAVSVTLSHAMLYLRASSPSSPSPSLSITKELINKYAFLGEKCIHGDPSGIDNYIATYGGTILYRKGIPPTPLPKPLSSQILLTYTNITRSTKTLVSNVRNLHESYPHIIDPIFLAMDQLALSAFQSLSTGHNMPLPDLIQLNQNLLESLRVSHQMIANIIQLSNNLNIGPTKLTGAGGGGCTFTLIQNTKNLPHFKSILQNDPYNFQIWETSLGGDGCLIANLSSSLAKDIQSTLQHIFNNRHNIPTQEINDFLLPGNNQNLSWH